VGSDLGPASKGPASTNEGHDRLEDVESDAEARGAVGRHDSIVPAKKAVQPCAGLEKGLRLLIGRLLGVFRSLVCFVGGSVSLVFRSLRGIVGAFSGMVTRVRVIGALGCF
jgi:hypothetical protein